MQHKWLTDVFDDLVGKIEGSAELEVGCDEAEGDSEGCAKVEGGNDGLELFSTFDNF